MLFVAHLYFTVPHYQAKSTPIIFQCTLGDTVVKHIELTNPTSKQISYYVKYEGHSDFSIEDDVVKLEPKQSQVKFKVTF